MYVLSEDLKIGGNMVNYEFNELNGYKTKVEKLIENNIINDTDIQIAKDKICKFVNEKQRWLRKNFIQDKCNSETVISVKNKEIYSLRYFLADGSIKLDDIIKYSLKKDYISCLLNIINIIILSLTLKNNCFFEGIIFAILSFIFFVFSKRYIYKVSSDDVFEKIKRSFDHTDLNNGHYIFVSIWTSVELFYIFNVLAEVDQLIPYLFITMLILLLFSFLYYIGLNRINSIIVIIFFLCTVFIDFEAWSGIVSIFSLLIILFSEDVWRGIYDTSERQKFENLNNFNIEKVKNKTYALKLLISLLTILLYYFLFIVNKFKLKEAIFCKLKGEIWIRYFNMYLIMALMYIIVFSIFIFILFKLSKSKIFARILTSLSSFVYKDVIDFSPDIIDYYEIQQEELITFNPRILVRNINELSEVDEVLINMPIRDGMNKIFITSHEGSILYIKDCTINIK